MQIDNGEKAKSAIGIFVYGTLMEGFINYKHYLKKHVISKCSGTMEGDLYHLSYGYPAAIKGNGTVYGEIIMVNNLTKLLVSLDYLEDYNQPGFEDMYTRELVQVSDGNGTYCNCYAYLWSEKRYGELQISGIKIIHGDWKKYVNDNKIKTKY